MNIDGDEWTRRFFIGYASVLGLVIAAITLGTKVGRGFLLFVIVLLSIILGLGWAVDVLHEGYKQYTQ